MPKPPATKPQTAQQRSGVSASSAARPDTPAVGRDGAAVVVADAARGRGSRGGTTTTRSRTDGQAHGESTPGEAEGGQKARASTEGEAGGGPGAKGGRRPTCGSLTATAEGASAVAIPTPNEDIPPISGEVYSPSDDISHISGDTPPPSLNITISSAEIPPYFPEPGTSVRAPTVSKSLGRSNGKIIPHERDEDIAKQITDWVAIGAVENEIANFLNIRPGVLRKHYARELDTGKFVNDMAVGKTILDLAKSGESERMTLLYAKARMGWRESDANDQNNAALLNIHIHQ